MCICPTKDEGSEFLETAPVLDSFGQWALADWPRKIRSKEQLAQELADEEKAFGSAADFGYGKYGGYKNTQARATGFFRVEKIDGRWWFVDPEGHLFLSTGTNGSPGGGAGFGGNDAGAAADRAARRLDSWGMTTGGRGRPSTVMLRWPQSTSFLGMPDVYSAQFAAAIDAAANTQCTPRKNDPLVLGYFIGNEPPWNGRESELCGLILGGPETATQAKLKEFLAAGDTAARRKEFVLASFQKYLETVCGAVRKYDPNHLLLGTRYGGTMADEYFVAARIFDVCSINVYEYEPTRQIIHAGRLTRPADLDWGVPHRRAGGRTGRGTGAGGEPDGARRRVPVLRGAGCVAGVVPGRVLVCVEGRAGAGPHGRRELQHRVCGCDGPAVQGAGGGGEGDAQTAAGRALRQAAAVCAAPHGVGRGRALDAVAAGRIGLDSLAVSSG